MVSTPESAVNSHFTFVNARLLRLSIILNNISFSSSCSCCYWFFEITGGKGIEFLEKSFMVDIMRAITGEVHTYQSIHPVDRAITQNKNINLYVRSFIDPDAKGTLVGNLKYDKLVPSFIFKMEQVLIRILLLKRKVQ